MNLAEIVKNNNQPFFPVLFLRINLNSLLNQLCSTLWHIFKYVQYSFWQVQNCFTCNFDCFIPKVYLWPTIYYAGCVNVFTARFVLREKNTNTTNSQRSEENLNHHDSSVPPALHCGNATQCWRYSTQHGQTVRWS